METEPPPRPGHVRMYLDKPKDLKPGDLFVGQHASGLAMVDRPLSGTALHSRLVAYLREVRKAQPFEQTATEILNLVLTSVHTQITFEVTRILGVGTTEDDDAR